MSSSRAAVPVALSAVLGLILAGCGGDGQFGDTSRREASQTSPSSAGGSSAPASGAAEPRGDQVKIYITIDDERFQATIFENPAGRDLIKQLPLTVDMVDHGGVEKTGPMPAPLSLDGQPEGADPDVGDVGYYAPGNNLVLYYGDQSYFPGIVIVGRLDGDAARRIGAFEGAVTATLESRAT